MLWIGMQLVSLAPKLYHDFQAQLPSESAPSDPTSTAVDVEQLTRWRTSVEQLASACTAGEEVTREQLLDIQTNFYDNVDQLVGQTQLDTIDQGCDIALAMAGQQDCQAEVWRLACDAIALRLQAKSAPCAVRSKLQELLANIRSLNGVQDCVAVMTEFISGLPSLQRSLEQEVADDVPYPVVWRVNDDTNALLLLGIVASRLNEGVMTANDIQYCCFAIEDMGEDLNRAHRANTSGVGGSGELRPSIPFPPRRQQPLVDTGSIWIVEVQAYFVEIGEAASAIRARFSDSSWRFKAMPASFRRPPGLSTRTSSYRWMEPGDSETRGFKQREFATYTPLKYLLTSPQGAEPILAALGSLRIRRIDRERRKIEVVIDDLHTGSQEISLSQFGEDVHLNDQRF